MPVLWKGRAGVFRREVGDGEHAEVLIDGRVYRVRLSELELIKWTKKRGGTRPSKGSERGPGADLLAAHTRVYWRYHAIRLMHS